VWNSTTRHYHNNKKTYIFVVTIKQQEAKNFQHDRKEEKEKEKEFKDDTLKAKHKSQTRVVVAGSTQTPWSSSRDAKCRWLLNREVKLVDVQPAGPRYPHPLCGGNVNAAQV
jgi:hypothetical protein